MIGRRNILLLCMLGVLAGLTISAIAQESASSASSSSAAAPAPTRAAGAAPAAKPPSASAATAADAAAVERSLRVEGEKRFRTNCGRCHMTPHKFPPRVMATAIRHMRVRATITDEDMRLILRYMTQ
jgi:mono/diheme cytochrome c family protein